MRPLALRCVISLAAALAVAALAVAQAPAWRSEGPYLASASDVAVDASYAGLGLTGSVREALAVETPVVATVSGLPVANAARSIASATSAAASNASWRAGISTAPA